MRKRPRNSASSYAKVGIRSLLSSLPPAPRNAPKIQPPALTNRANQTEPPAVRVPSSTGPPVHRRLSPAPPRPLCCGGRTVGRLDGCGGHVVTHGEERGRGLAAREEDVSPHPASSSSAASVLQAPSPVTHQQPARPPRRTQRYDSSPLSSAPATVERSAWAPITCSSSFSFFFI